MNAAVLAHATGSPGSAAPAVRLETKERTTEWIDPEGDDWLASIYRLVTQDPEPVSAGGHMSAETEHWFG